MQFKNIDLNPSNNEIVCEKEREKASECIICYFVLS